MEDLFQKYADSLSTKLSHFNFLDKKGYTHFNEVAFKTKEDAIEVFQLIKTEVEALISKLEVEITSEFTDDSFSLIALDSQNKQGKYKIEIREGFTSPFYYFMEIIPLPSRHTWNGISFGNICTTSYEKMTQSIFKNISLFVKNHEKIISQGNYCDKNSFKVSPQFEKLTFFIQKALPLPSYILYICYGQTHINT